MPTYIPISNPDPWGPIRGRVPNWVLDVASLLLPTDPREQLMQLGPGMITSPELAAVRNMERLGRALERLGLLTARVPPLPSMPDRYAIEFLFPKVLPKGRKKLFPTAGRILTTEVDPKNLVLQLFRGQHTGLDDIIEEGYLEKVKGFTPKELILWLQKSAPIDVSTIVNKPSELLRRLRYYYDEKYIAKLAKMLKQIEPKKP